MAISRSQIPMQVSPSFEGGGIRYLNVGGTPNNPNAGQGSRMWANMLGNRLGVRGIPYIGDKFTNLADTGFQKLGQSLQWLPGAKGIGNLINRVGRRVNQVTDFRDRLNPMTNFNNPTRGGLFGLRGKGGPLGFGLLGRGRRERQAQQAYQDLTNYDVNAGYPLSPAQQAYQDLTNYDVNAGYPVAQQASIWDNPNYQRMTSAIGPGMDMDSYGFGQNIQTPDAAGIAAGVERDVIKSLPFRTENISVPQGNFYRLIDKETGNVIMSGKHHKDYRPKGPRLQNIGGGM